MTKFKILVVDAISGGSGTPGHISQIVMEFNSLLDAQDAYDMLEDSRERMVAPAYNCTMSRNVTKLFKS